jgi:hypothetical protein
VEHLREIRAKPAPVAHLDGVAEALGQTFKEVFEDAHPFDVEGRRELQEERSEPVCKLGHCVDKALRLGLGTDQVLFAGDLLGVLYTNHKRTHSHGRRL